MLRDDQYRELTRTVPVSGRKRLSWWPKRENLFKIKKPPWHSLSCDHFRYALKLICCRSAELLRSNDTWFNMVLLEAPHDHREWLQRTNTAFILALHSFRITFVCHVLAQLELLFTGGYGLHQSNGSVGKAFACVPLCRSASVFVQVHHASVASASANCIAATNLQVDWRCKLSNIFCLTRCHYLLCCSHSKAISPYRMSNT
jgi:hypothetical protein